MKFQILFIVALLTISKAFAQQPTSAPTPVLYSEKTLSELNRIQKAALSSDYALSQVAYLSNNIGPRLSGSPQAERAVQYVAQEMRRLGLAVRLQKVMVPHWVRGAEHGELIGYDGMAPGTTQKIVLTALGGSIATPADGKIRW